MHSNSVSFPDWHWSSKVLWFTALCFTAIISLCINVDTFICIQYVIVTHLFEDSDKQPEFCMTPIPFVIVKETSVYWHKAATARDFTRKKVCSTTTINPVTLTERPQQLANGAILGIWVNAINISIESYVINIIE